MTTAEFRKANIIDKLKANLFFIGNYKGPVNFYIIDSDYATLFNNFRVGLHQFIDSINALDDIANDTDEAILIKHYINVSNNFYNYVFKTTGTNLRLKDVTKLMQQFQEDKGDGKIFCYLLELRYHKKFSLGYFNGHYSWNYNEDKATFVCPADTDEWIYDEIASSCWNDPVDCIIQF